MTLVVFESRNNMVRRFAVKALLWWMTDRLTSRLTTRGCVRTRIMCTRKGNKDTKICGGVKPQVVYRRVI